MERIALISDIHSNIHALNAFMNYIDNECKVSQIWRRAFLPMITLFSPIILSTKLFQELFPMATAINGISVLIVITVSVIQSYVEVTEKDYP